MLAATWTTRRDVDEKPLPCDAIAGYPAAGGRPIKPYSRRSLKPTLCGSPGGMPAFLAVRSRTTCAPSNGGRRLEVGCGYRGA